MTNAPPTGAAAVRPHPRIGVSSSAARPRRNAQRSAAGWYPFTCAVLTAGGATAGLIAVLREIGYQSCPPAQGLAAATAALCAGIVLGLWIPRRIIRRRLTPRHAGARTPTGDGRPVLGVEFVAALTGGLIIVFGGVWSVLAAGTLVAEDYRALLAGRFVHPAWLSRLLLEVPILVGLLLAGASGTMLLVALHGWYRLAARARLRLARLWGGILLSVVGVGLLVRTGPSAGLLTWLGPLLIFGAAPIAVWQRAGTLTAPATVAGERSAVGSELLALLTAGCAAAATALALYLTMPSFGVGPAEFGSGVAALAAAAAFGMVAASMLALLRSGADLAPALLLATGVGLVLPGGLLDPGEVALVRLALVTFFAAGCIVLSARRVSRTDRDVQRALSWVGRFVAGGFAVVMALAAASAGHWERPVPLLIATLLITAATGLVLILDNRARPAIRAVGLCGVGLWLVLLPWPGRRLLEAARAPGSEPLPAGEPTFATAGDRAGPAGSLPTRSASESALAAELRRLVAAESFRVGHVVLSGRDTGADSPWEFDLAGPPLDLVILQTRSWSPGSGVPDDESGRRLLRRLRARLSDGGRLMVELPTAPFVRAALRDLAALEAMPGFLLCIRRGTAVSEAVLFGADIPALIADRSESLGHGRTAELDISLEPLRRAVAVQGRAQVGRRPRTR